MCEVCCRVTVGLIGTDRCRVLVPEAPPLDVKTGHMTGVVRNLTRDCTTNDEVGRRTIDAATGRDPRRRTESVPRGRC